MSMETDRWTELSPDQATFFAGQTEFVRQAAFSPASQEAGITALDARRYSFQLDQHQALHAIMWPDPYEQGGACITMANGRSTSNNYATFVRIARTEESYAVEGITLGLNYSLKGTNLYGQQLLLRHGMEEEGSLPSIGANFLISAINRSQAIAKQTSPLGINKPHIRGIEGGVTARLFRSLSSFGSNLVIAGATGERNPFTSQTYDLAQALLKVAMSSTMAMQNAKATSRDGIIGDRNNRPCGAVFESESDGITVVRRTGAFPDTIAVASVGRPHVDDHVLFVEQHSIQARGTSLQVMTLPTEDYNPPALVRALSLLDANPKEADAGPSFSSGFDEKSNQALGQRLVRLLTERIGQRV